MNKTLVGLSGGFFILESLTILFLLLLPYLSFLKSIFIYLIIGIINFVFLIVLIIGINSDGKNTIS